MSILELGQSDQKMERDNPPFQVAFTDQIAIRDAFTHQIWNFFLKEYKRCAPDTIILKTRSKVKVTVTRKWYLHVAIWNYCLKEYRRYAPDSQQFLETRSEVKVNATETQEWCATLCRTQRCIHIPNLGFLP